MVVVVAALGVRTACFVGMAIPGSFLAGILVLAVGGLTVNMVVLFGLILAAGMLVDGAIVVTEYADRKMSEGLPKQEAYALAGKRRSEEHTSELQSLMRISYAVFCLKKKKKKRNK